MGNRRDDAFGAIRDALKGYQRDVFLDEIDCDDLVKIYEAGRRELLDELMAEVEAMPSGVFNCGIDGPAYHRMIRLDAVLELLDAEGGCE